MERSVSASLPMLLLLLLLLWCPLNSLAQDLDESVRRTSLTLLAKDNLLQTDVAPEMIAEDL